MQGLLERPDRTGLFSDSCEVSRGIFMPDIVPEEAKGVTASCSNPFGVNVITCKDINRDIFLEEVGGLSLDLPLTSEANGLPNYIPVVDYRGRNFSIPSTVVGVTLLDILSKGVVFKSGCWQEQNEIVFRKDLLKSKAFCGKKNILFLTGPDTLIEWVWYNRRECRFFEVIKEMGFSAVGGFNFSIIGGECAFAQALNQKRSLFSSYLLQQHGINSIPHVYALTKFHIDRWKQWFHQNPEVSLFTMNCQLHKDKTDIDLVIEIINELLTSFPNLHAILQGFPLPRIKKFGSNISRIHFADKKPIKFSQFGRKILFDRQRQKLTEQRQKKGNIQDLINSNFIVQEKFIEDMTNKFKIKKN